MRNQKSHSSIAPIALATVLTGISTNAYADGIGSNHYGGNWEWGHMMIGSPMMILAIVLIAVFVGLVVRRARNKYSPSEAPSSVLEVLRQRYERGEIDKDEFEERRSVLSPNA